MQKKSIVTAAMAVMGIAVVIVMKLSITPDVHVPNGMELEEHTQQEADKSDTSEASVLLGEEAVLKLIPEMFAPLGDCQQPQVTLAENCVHIVCKLPAQGILQRIQASSDIISQSQYFLLQQKKTDTFAVSARLSCADDSFYLAELNVGGLVITAFDEELSDAFCTAFRRETEKQLSQIQEISTDRDGIHISGTAA